MKNTNRQKEYLAKAEQQMEQSAMEFSESMEEGQELYLLKYMTPAALEVLRDQCSKELDERTSGE